MAHPFGTPSLGAYLIWARAQGCQVNSCYGGPFGSGAVRIVAPDGSSLVLAGLDQKDRLTLTVLENLERRLGLPWTGG